MQAVRRHIIEVLLADHIAVFKNQKPIGVRAGNKVLEGMGLPIHAGVSNLT